MSYHVITIIFGFVEFVLLLRKLNQITNHDVLMSKELSFVSHICYSHPLQAAGRQDYVLASQESIDTTCSTRVILLSNKRLLHDALVACRLLPVPHFRSWR